MASIGFWIAINGVSLDKAAKQIGVMQVAGSHLSHPLDAGLSCGTLKNGYALFLFFGNGGDALMEDPALVRLSEGSKLMMVIVDEYSMRSEAHFWANGQKVWSVLHDAQTGDNNHLNVQGDRFPKSLENHRVKAVESYEAEQEVDFMFDVPLYLAREMTGFKHDDAKTPSGSAFFKMEVESANRQSIIGRADRPWWKFW